MRALQQDDVTACCSCNRVRLGAVDNFSAQPEILALQGERVSHTYCPECAERELGIDRAKYIELHEVRPINPNGPTEIAAVITKCRHISHEMHKGELRVGGATYISHLEKVAAGVPDRLKPIALLHEIVEHGHLSLDHLRALNLPEYVVNGVDAMTRRPNETYADFIRRVKLNPDATAVKMVDIRVNDSDLPNPSMRVRYAKALSELESRVPDAVVA